MELCLFLQEIEKPSMTFPAADGVGFQVNNGKIGMRAFTTRYVKQLVKLAIATAVRYGKLNYQKTA